MQGKIVSGFLAALNFQEQMKFEELIQYKNKPETTEKALHPPGVYSLVLMFFRSRFLWEKSLSTKQRCKLFWIVEAETG